MERGRTPFDVQGRDLEPDGRAEGRRSARLSHWGGVVLTGQRGLRWEGDV